jgi:hypothetical protein
VPSGRPTVRGRVYSWLVPRVVFPAYERLAGRRLGTAVGELRHHQWRSADEVAARAASRLQALLAHAVVSRLMWKMLGRTFRCGSDVAA